MSPLSCTSIFEFPHAIKSALGIVSLVTINQRPFKGASDADKGKPRDVDEVINTKYHRYEVHCPWGDGLEEKPREFEYDIFRDVDGTTCRIGLSENVDFEVSPNSTRTWTSAEQKNPALHQQTLDNPQGWYLEKDVAAQDLTERLKIQLLASARHQAERARTGKESPAEGLDEEWLQQLTTKPEGYQPVFLRDHNGRVSIKWCLWYADVPCPINKYSALGLFKGMIKIKNGKAYLSCPHLSIEVGGVEIHGHYLFGLIGHLMLGGRNHSDEDIETRNQYIEHDLARPNAGYRPIITRFEQMGDIFWDQTPARDFSSISDEVLRKEDDLLIHCIMTAGAPAMHRGWKMSNSCFGFVRTFVQELVESSAMSRGSVISEGARLMPLFSKVILYGQRKSSQLREMGKIRRVLGIKTWFAARRTKRGDIIQSADELN